MRRNYDVIIVGAGSVGTPAAMALAKKGLQTLTIDAHPSPGQGDNKKAIGGIRATHSDPAKIMIGKHSLEIFSTWEQIYGDKIEWMEGGYLFPIYRNKEKKALTSLIPTQHKYGLNIHFIDPYEIKKIVSTINSDNLIGGTFSPHDGSASPLLSINAFTKQAIRNGAEFKFKETVEKILINKNAVYGVQTNKQKYKSPILIDAAGTNSHQLCQTAGSNIHIIPDLHEAAITEPIDRLFECMIVDLRPNPGSKNFYLYQNIHGQIIFCITPKPPITGTDSSETSSFLTQATKRIVNLIPSLHNVRVRRMWRGCYPMTPDGSPLVGWSKTLKGLFHLTGMCGQGFMLGPGIGEFASRIITNTHNNTDKDVQKLWSPQRQLLDKQEALK